MAEIKTSNLVIQEVISVGGSASPSRRQRMLITATAVSGGDTIDFSDHPEYAAIESIQYPMIAGSTGTTGTAQIDVNGTVIRLGKIAEYKIDCLMRLV